MASRRVSFAISWLLPAFLGTTTGCFPPDEGRAVPLDKIYFPVGIAVSPGKSWMYLANSDFDLQFNAGTVQVYDLAKLRGLVPEYCRSDSDCTGDNQACDTTAEGTEKWGLTAPTNRCVDRDRRNPCERAGRGVVPQSVSDQILAPGLCSPIEPGPLQLDSVSIGAFATDVIYATNPLRDGKGARLFIPVRGDATLHFIDVDDDTDYLDPAINHTTKTTLSCGQTKSNPACDQNHRRGTEPQEDNTRNATLPPEPFGIALQARPYGGLPDSQGRQFIKGVPLELPDGGPLPDGGRVDVTDTTESLVTTHQTSGQVALFVAHWTTTPGGEDGPELEFVGGGLPSGALSVAPVPLPAYTVENPGASYLPSFLLTYRNAAQVSLVRAFDDLGAHPSRPFLDASRVTNIATNSTGFDSRGIALDSSARTQCESPDTGACVPPSDKSIPFDRNQCLLNECESIPLDAYVANRGPASLIVGHTPPGVPNALTDDLPQFDQTIAMSDGPSRVVVGDVIDTTGQHVRRVFIVCFDSRRIFVYDPVAQRFETQIVTGRGPHAFALDSSKLGVSDEDSYAYGYLGHFSDSYLGVIDLDQRHTATYGKIVLSVGQRTPPRASK
jgi:hypothetical protein